MKSSSLFRIIVLICLFPITIYPQQREIDSLRGVLIKIQKKSNFERDTNYLKTLNDLAYKYYNINPDSTYILANQSRDLSLKIDYKSGVAESLRCLGLSYLMKSDFNSALEYYNQALLQAEQGGYKVIVSRCLNNIGIFYQIQGNYTNALENHFKALKIREEMKDQQGVAMSYTNLGNVYIMQGLYKEAIEMHNKAIQIRNGIADSQGISDNYSSLAYIYGELGNLPQALEMNFKSLKIFEQLGNKQNIAIVTNNIARIYQKQYKNQEALDMYFRALKISEEVGDKKGNSDYLNNIASIYSLQGKNDEAFEMYSKSLKIKEEIGDNDGMAKCLSGIGSFYYKKGMIDKALEYLHKAQKLNIELGDIALESGIMNYLALCYLEKKDYSQSLRFANKGFKDSQESGLKDETSSLASTLSEIYERIGNPLQALKYYKLFKNYSDSLIDREKELKTQWLQADYEYQKKEVQLLAEQKQRELEHQKKLAGQRYLTLLFIVAFIGVVVIVFFVYKGRQKEKKAKLLLQTKNKEISKKNTILHQQKEDLEEAHRNIKASINYARLIQNAIMPSPEILSSNLPEYFIIYKPRDIVSGDFYWFRQIKNLLYIAAADCTGHGVPGAFMSMMGISLLNEIVSKRDANPPDIILNELRKRLKKSLHQTQERHETQDGMDIAFLMIDLDRKTLLYSGANNPLIIFRKNGGDTNYSLFEIKADRMPIGVHPNDIYDFKLNEYKLESDDTVYLFSDGYSSQFGGPGYNKLKSKKFQELLYSVQGNSMSEQKQYLEKFLSDWQGKHEQVDDILVIGIKI